mmetsp:Transcript_20539/g.78710  ORF Transcript_20539/g.78710 Transcript_20539/m.78710 type:complete len:303 (-) Transcript_20539:267-1175(-)
MLQHSSSEVRLQPQSGCLEQRDCDFLVEGDLQRSHQIVEFRDRRAVGRTAVHGNESGGQLDVQPSAIFPQLLLHQCLQILALLLHAVGGVGDRQRREEGLVERQTSSLHPLFQQSELLLVAPGAVELDKRVRQLGVERNAQLLEPPVCCLPLFPLLGISAVRNEHTERRRVCWGTTGEVSVKSAVEEHLRLLKCVIAAGVHAEESEAQPGAPGGVPLDQRADLSAPLERATYAARLQGSCERNRVRGGAISLRVFLQYLQCSVRVADDSEVVHHGVAGGDALVALHRLGQLPDLLELTHRSS